MTEKYLVQQKIEQSKIVKPVIEKQKIRYKVRYKFRNKPKGIWNIPDNF